MKELMSYNTERLRNTFRGIAKFSRGIEMEHCSEIGLTYLTMRDKSSITFSKWVKFPLSQLKNSFNLMYVRRSYLVHS